MSERSHHRRPATFKLDDPGVIVIDPDDSSRPPRGTVHVAPEVDPALLPVPVEPPILRAQPGFRWGAVFWTAIGGLILLGLGLGVTRLIEDLFARSEGLGFLGIAFAFAATLAFAVVVGGEAFGLARLAGHRRQSTCIDRRAVRIRSVPASDPAVGASVRRTAGSARHDPPDASRHRAYRHHRRHGGKRQPGPAGARPWHRGKIVAAARRTRS